MTLKTFLGALAAAGAAYVLNRLSRRLLGRAAIVFLAPAFEEALKTGAALTIGAPVLATHFAFGGLEAVYDLFSGRRPRGGPGLRLTPRRIAAALAGLAGHTLFGSVTVAVAAAVGSWAAGTGAAYLLHVGWNALVMGRVGAGD